MDLHVEIDGLPPSANHAYQHVQQRARAGHTYTARRLSAEAEAWRKGAALVIRAAATAGFTLAPRTLWALTVALSVPALYRSDLDNRLKVCLDAVCLALEADDRYCTQLAAHKRREAVEQVSVTIRTEVV